MHHTRTTSASESIESISMLSCAVADAANCAETLNQSMQNVYKVGSRRATVFSEPEVSAVAYLNARMQEVCRSTCVAATVVPNLASICVDGGCVTTREGTHHAAAIPTVSGFAHVAAKSKVNVNAQLLQSICHACDHRVIEGLLAPPGFEGAFSLPTWASRWAIEHAVALLARPVGRRDKTLVGTTLGLMHVCDPACNAVSKLKVYVRKQAMQVIEETHPQQVRLPHPSGAVPHPASS